MREIAFELLRTKSALETANGILLEHGLIGVLADTINEPNEEEIKAIDNLLKGETDKLRTACELVLLFHSGSPWTSEKRNEWFNKVTSILPLSDAVKAEGNPDPVAEATTRVLCASVRAAIASSPEKAHSDRKDTKL